jgi:hypothetical protein
MKITNVNGEYDTQKSSIWLRQGSLDLEMQIGGGRSVYHWITAYADMLKVRWWTTHAIRLLKSIL